MTSMFEIIAKVDWSIMADAAQVVEVIVTFSALVFAYFQYRLHQKTNKYETYSKMNERYCSDKAIQKVLDCMLKSYDKKGEFDINIFKDISTKSNLSDNDKEMFLRFFEELNYAVEKRAIGIEDACYFFGYYAIVAYLMEEDFVSDFSCGGMWIGFKELAKEMKDIAEYNGYYRLERKGKLIKI